MRRIKSSWFAVALGFAAVAAFLALLAGMVVVWSGEAIAQEKSPAASREKETPPVATPAGKTPPAVNGTGQSQPTVLSDEANPLGFPQPGERPDTSLFPVVTFVPDTTFLADTALVFLLEAGSRLYPDWKEEHRVRAGEVFFLGDTEFTAAVQRFLPDFRLVDGRPVTASRNLANPAVRILTYKEGAPVDSAWAFLNFPPHFSPRSFFTFQLKQIVGYEEPAGAGSGAGAAAPDSGAAKGTER